jgi:Na+/proline symporter
MSTLDYIVLLGYLGGTLALGLFFAKRTRTVSDMFAAGGHSPWWVAGLSSFMTMFSAGTFVIWGGIAYKYGVVAIVINMSYGIAALAAGYLVAGRWNALGIRTPAQYIDLRFGSKATQFYTWTLLAFRVVDISITLYALAVVLATLMPLPEGHFLRDADTGRISVPLLTCVFGSIIILYTIVGGLWAVLMTDVLQFVILNLAVIFVLVLTVVGIGNFAGIVATAPPDFFSPTAGGYGLLFLGGWCATQFFIIGADWAFAQRFLSVSSPRNARKATYLFGCLYLVSPLIWLSPPLLYRLTHPGANPEQAYILAGQAVLPAGMIGLMVAAMFSATASTVSGYLNVFAGVLTNDVYRRIFRAAAGERELVVAGRVFSGLVGLTLVVFATVVPHLGGAERVVILWATLIVGPLMAPTIWGLLSSRITTRALWMTVVTSFVAGLVLKVLAQADGRFGLWALDGMLDWARTSGSTVDVIIGVILPVVVLTIAHFVSTGEASGWIRVLRSASAARAAVGPPRPADTVPALALGVSMVVSGIAVVALVPFNPTYRASLSSFGIAVLLLGIAVWLAAKRVRARNARADQLVENMT